jgi:hypothetical protein
MKNLSKNPRFDDIDKKSRRNQKITMIVSEQNRLFLQAR